MAEKKVTCVYEMIVGENNRDVSEDEAIAQLKKRFRVIEIRKTLPFLRISGHKAVMVEFEAEFSEIKE